MSETAEVFWDYSLKLWKNDELKILLLEHQDKQGLDINLLLFLLWISEQRMMLTTDPSQIIELQRRWIDGLIKPIRGLRRENQNINELKNSLLQAELVAEKHYQKALCNLLNDDSMVATPPNYDRAATIKRNLNSYIKIDWDNDLLLLLSKASP